MTQTKKTMTFAELQRKMKVAKNKQGHGYDYRDTASILDLFKSLDSGWVLEFDEDVVCLGDPLESRNKETIINKDGTKTISEKHKKIPSIFFKVTVKAILGEEVHTGSANSYMGEQGLSKSGNKPQNDPQWSGTTSTYATKRALEKLFALGSEEVEADDLIPEETQEVMKELESILQNAVASEILKENEASRYWENSIGIGDLEEAERIIKAIKKEMKNDK